MTSERSNMKNDKIEIIVYGDPIAKKRPRFARHGKFVRAYNEQETEEGRFLHSVMNQIVISKPIDTPVKVKMDFTFRRPKGHYGTGKNAGTIKTSAPKYHVIKPDLDNLEKFVMDCLNRNVWYDDSIVVRLSTAKRYGDEPKTEITIERIAV